MHRALWIVPMGLVGLACQPSSPSAGEPPKPAAAAAAPSEGDLASSTVVARWKDKGAERTLTFGELREARAATFLKLDRDRHEAIKRELEGYVLDQLVQAEAQRKGKTQEVYLEELAAAVPEDKVKEFYETTVARGGKGPPMDQVADRIRQFLAMGEEIERLKKEAGLTLTLPEPETPTASFDLADRPRKGPADAKVTIVEFSDFQCPYCARVTEPLAELTKAFPDDVQVYFLHYPLNFHPQAMPAAKAARCAQKQNKFWEMHDKIFADTQKMSDEDLLEHAKALSLDMAQFGKCMDDPATEKFVKDDMAQGTKAGVGGTPSFFVNGKASQGPPSAEQVRGLLGS